MYIRQIFAHTHEHCVSLWLISSLWIKNQKGDFNHQPNDTYWGVDWVLKKPFTAEILQVLQFQVQAALIICLSDMALKEHTISVQSITSLHEKIPGRVPGKAFMLQLERQELSFFRCGTNQLCSNTVLLRPVLDSWLLIQIIEYDVTRLPCWRRMEKAADVIWLHLS